jgi:hypothetical protein
LKGLGHERLYRLLPDIAFDIRRVSVSGGPVNTLVVAEWRETNSGTDGVRTSAEGVHVLTLRWGRATRLIISPDTVKLQATLDRLFDKGVQEAHAARIVDCAPPRSRSANGIAIIPRCVSALARAVREQMAPVHAGGGHAPTMPC